jgi:hypothetical protein
MIYRYAFGSDTAQLQVFLYYMILSLLMPDVHLNINNPLSAVQKTLCVSTTKTNWLISLGSMAHVYRENHVHCVRIIQSLLMLQVVLQTVNTSF